MKSIKYRLTTCFAFATYRNFSRNAESTTGGHMIVERSSTIGVDVLVRAVDSHLDALRPELAGTDLDLAERLAVCLRGLVRVTAESSAADRARVRVAVRHFVRTPLSRRLASARSMAIVRGLVDEIAEQLGRPELAVRPPNAGT